MLKYARRSAYLAARSCAAAIVFAATASAVMAGADTRGVIEWRSGAFATAAQSPAEIASVADATRGFGERVVLQLERPLDARMHAALTGAGVRLLEYVGDNAYFASLDNARASGAAVAAVRGVRCVLPIAREWKLHPDVLAGVVHPWAIVPTESGEPDRSDDPIVAAYVTLFADADLIADGAEVVNLSAGMIRSTVPIVNGLVVELPASAMAALADHPAVQWVEPPLPQFTELNDSNRNRVGADIVQQAPYGLDGTGVTALVYDGGKVRATHVDFGGRAIIGDATDATSDHATHVAGTIGGSGQASGGLRKGMAPAVGIISHQFETAGPLQQGFLYTDPGDLYADYFNSINVHGADIANNSIGTNTSTNLYPCEWQGDYGFTDTIIDKIVRGDGTDPNFAAPFRVIWANGNERQSTRCLDPCVPAGYHLTAPPACAKNHITVGALNSNDDSMTTFSSWGPADDGRIKPDISAPGCQSNDDLDVTSCSSSSDIAYTGKCGTSMASPTTCGVGALLIQDWRQQHPGEPDFRNSMLKCFLAHTAADIEQPGPDYKTGYGSIRAPAAVDLLRSGNFTEGAIAQGEVFNATLIVAAGEAPLKVTIAWDDVAGTPNVNPVLVNDLDLRVVDAQNNVHFPWTLGGLANPAANAVRTQANHVDNIEQVVIDAPLPGAYRIEVSGFNVPVGPQTFSLTATPTLANCSSAGIARLDRTHYRCVTSALLRVTDCDLNTSDLVVDTVAVQIASTSDPVGLTVVLTEVDPAAATFLASIEFGPVGGPETLRVVEGDTVTLTYVDEDNGSGGEPPPVTVTATALVDCTAPQITNVAANFTSPYAGNATFDTNEDTAPTVRYGLVCGDLTNSKNGIPFQTAHSINLAPLTDGTTYFLDIRVEDRAGNAATADNGGACYSFTTPDIPDYFTEHFASSDNDLDFKTIEFSPDGSFDFYEGCVEDITELPVDIAGHTPLGFTSDNQSLPIMLTGGATVKLYGAAYSQIYVGSNGYLTFTASDTDSTESLADHFDTPRVSALFDDLDPVQAGTEVWAQLDDRVVITFLNVTEDVTTSNSNTFQYELFFDGTIRIHYLGVAAVDGLAGISAGAGLPTDFVESNLAGMAGCGPRPPRAKNVNAQTPVNVNANVAFDATDDGLPDPPAAMTFKVMSLPQHGRLLDPGAAQIATTPYTLVGGGAVVVYDPDYNYQGLDSFSYAANDGGLPPEGGDSNVATATITVGGPGKIYEFLLNTNPGWTLSGQWQFGDPAGLGGLSHGNPDPQNAFTGTNVYGVNLNGDYSTTPIGGPWSVTTGPIDLSDATQTSVRFRRWLNTDFPPYAASRVEVSTDGVNWTNAWVHTGSAPIADSAWTQQSYSLSPTADNQPAVRIRWTYTLTNGVFAYSGWNIDDIEVWGLVPLAPGGCSGDLTCDGQISFADIDRFVEALGFPGGAGWPYDCPWINGDTNGDDNVNFADIDPFVALIGTQCR